MKNLILGILFLLLFITGCSKDDNPEAIQESCNFIDFLYYDGAFDLGEMSNDYVLIGVDTLYSDNEIKNFVLTLTDFDQNYDFTIRHNNSGQYKFKETALKLNSSKTCENITQIISDLKQKSIVSYAHFTMRTDDCQSPFGQPLGDLCINTYGSDFLVKVFDENDLSLLNQMIEDTNTEFVKQNEFMPKWFELRATKASNGDALAMANLFFESDLFEFSEPRVTKFPVE